MSHLANILNPEGSRAASENAPTSEESAAGTNDNTQPEFPPLQIRSAYTTYEHEPHPDCPDTLSCLPDTDGRPQHTLPVILRCSILGSPRKRLTIREIYQAMEEKYPFYKSAGPTWKQSVRHHLSLNRLFERQPRPVTDPGFGSYWTVNLSAPPGTKRPRKRGRNANKEGELIGKGSADYMPPDASTSSAGLANHISTTLTPVAGKRRGRPRKSSLNGARDDTPMSSNEEGGDGTATPLDGPPDSDGYESPHEADAVPTFERHEPMGPLGPASFTQHPPHHGRSPMSFQIPPVSNTTQDPSESSKDVIERLREEVGTLRRQSAEAVSVSLRLSEQLAQAQREIERARHEVRDLEDALEEEQTRRAEAERAAQRRMAMGPLENQVIVVPGLRSPQRSRGPV